MTQVTVKNDEPAGSTRLVAVTLVTVGNVEAGDEKHLLQPQQELALQVGAGQFVMVDDEDKEGA